MGKNPLLAQVISYTSWSSFVTRIKYKAKWFGEIVLKIERFELSGKICNICNFLQKRFKVEN